MRRNVPRMVRASVLMVSVLASPGNPLDQKMALRQHCHQHALEKMVLADDDLFTS